MARRRVVKVPSLLRSAVRFQLIDCGFKIGTVLLPMRDALGSACSDNGLTRQADSFGFGWRLTPKFCSEAQREASDAVWVCRLALFLDKVSKPR